MRLLIVGDLHGAMPELSTTDVDAIIAPGDFCLDKDIRPYVLQAYRAYLDGTDDKEWWEIPPLDEAKRIARASADAGRAILERLDSVGVPVFVIPGNWDFTGTNIDSEANEHLFGFDPWEELLLPGLRNVRDADRRALPLDGFTIIGYGRVNGPELLEHRGYDDEEAEEEARADYEELKEEYDTLFKKAKGPTILLSHNVPYDTPLDAIDNPDSPKNGEHYGSNLARYLIEEHHPLLCVAGHMHEHFGRYDLDGTVCINSGFGGKVNTLVTTEDGKVTDVTFVGKSAVPGHEDAKVY